MPDLEARLREALADRYRLEREIGRGGMATVYLADDLRHNRQVAIKALKTEIGAALGPERFLREIEIAAQLIHPHILPVYDSGEAAGTFFYVMPFVAGESLKDRLARESQLPLDEALRICLAVADALGEAHRLGIVHRDIKPANILLEAGHAVVADFGIAKALTDAGGTRLTSTGIAIGTAGYMSPEQATGQPNLDGRSDVYSLGCVLYEMLAGEPPFSGPSAQAVIGKQLGAPVPHVTVVRDALPAALDDVLGRCLAKAPADRFQSMAEFAAALDRMRHGRPAAPWYRRLRGRNVAAGGALVFVGAAAAVGLSRGIGDGAPGADTTRYAVQPFTIDRPVPSLDPVTRLQDALRRWDGISVAVDSEDEAAGRQIRGTVTHVDGALRVHAALYDAGSDRPLSDHAVRVPADAAGADSLMAVLADWLLTRGRPRDEWDQPWGTTSLPAQAAFSRGMTALDAWDLGSAEQEFVAAVAFDPGYARAHLWTALVRAWSDQERARWTVNAEQAALGTAALPQRERLLGEAVLAQARGDLGTACERWERVTAEQPETYAGWYGLARCAIGDTRVVADPGSPSGWSFRTSYHRALEAFARAFERRPAILGSFRARSYEALRTAFMVGSELRGGLGGEGDTVFFVADPAWLGDSLALIPYPAAAGAHRPPASTAEALRHQRERLRDVVLAWVTARPTSAAAMEALALGLAMLGDPAARDTLAHARALATEPAERFRVAAAEVWMRLAFALPWDETGVRRARMLADSLLAGAIPAAEPDPRLLPGLAALLGRATDAASWARAPPVADGMRVPPALRETAPALLVYAALGGPRDSIISLSGRVAAAIDASLLPAERDLARLAFIARPATLAFPDPLLPGAAALEGRGDYLLDMQLAWQRADTAAVRDGFGAIRTMRQGLPPGLVGLDALRPEAALLLELGETGAAAAWLDAGLRALNLVAPYELGSPALAASLVPAIALRARIARRVGDTTEARRWERAARELWGEAEGFLQPLVAAGREPVR